jgi:hypothetical protein
MSITLFGVNPEPVIVKVALFPEPVIEAVIIRAGVVACTSFDGGESPSELKATTLIVY